MVSAFLVTGRQQGLVEISVLPSALHHVRPLPRRSRSIKPVLWPRLTRHEFSCDGNWDLRLNQSTSGPASGL